MATAYRDLFPAGAPPVALITGANKGLGLETRRRLAGQGFVVVLGSRDIERGHLAAASLSGTGGRVHAVRLDVTDEVSIARAADLLAELTGRLDVLVNNAGMTVEVAAEDLTAAHLRSVFETNVFGVASVTSAMVPLLARSAHPRIVNVSSTTASLALTTAGTDFGGDADHRLAYSTSKTALNMLTVQYARALARDPRLAHIKVNAVTPGYTATDINAGRGARTVEQGARVIVERATLADDGPSATFANDEGPVPW